MNLTQHIAAIAALCCIQGCTLVKTVIHNTADLDDHRIFANRAVATADAPSGLRTLSRVPAFIAQLRVPDENGGIHDLDRYLDDTRTAAFVVMRDDRIVYERYARGFDERSLLNSFSIAKSIVGTLVGIAVSEGCLELDATVATYRRDFDGTPYGAVTVRSLVTMTSGMGDAPSYLPGRAQFYYGDDLRDVVTHSTPEARTGNGWRYSEADVQMLGFVLEAATGKSVSAYLAEKLWKPLGMESPALWALDREGGVEKAFCCISARARDFARFGRLYLEAGRWNGEQLVPAEWAARSVVRGIATHDGYLHQHLWWTPPGDQGDFYAYGHNGQYLYVNPASRTVIVKFSETNRQDPVPMFRAVAAALKPDARVAELDRLAARQLAAR
jgi:CubicO group peptidase (beta-lactamase class C family)